MEALGAGKGVEEEDGGALVKDDEPAVGGAAAAEALATRSFWQFKEVEFVAGEVEEGAVGGLGAALVGVGEHQPWELRREVFGRFGGGGPPAPADASESEVIGVDYEVFGD